MNPAIPATFDVVIIGGGPAGSTAATYLRRAGHSVLILEKGHYPRFKIGESLLPYICPMLEEMGVMEDVRAAGFMEKWGARFHVPCTGHTVRTEFGAGRFNNQAMAYQVERSVFDKLLLEHAQGSGATVLQDTAVIDWKINPEGSHATVTYKNKREGERTVEAKFVLDATGRANFTGNREKIREDMTDLRKVAIYGHFTGVKLDEGSKGGDIIIYRMKDRWFWFIPLSRDKVSIGLVTDRDKLKETGLTPDELFEKSVARNPDLHRRLAEARKVSEDKLHTTTDFSYKNQRFASERLVRIGDAAGFMDPVFSSGVHLAMFSAKDAALAVSKLLSREAAFGPELMRYEKKFRRMMDFYFEFIRGFYTQPFLEVLMEPFGKVPSRLRLPDAVNAALAGQVFPGWQVRWRLRMFFFVVRLQRKFALVPRIPWGRDPQSRALGRRLAQKEAFREVVTPPATNSEAK